MLRVERSWGSTRLHTQHLYKTTKKVTLICLQKWWQQRGSKCRVFPGGRLCSALPWQKEFPPAVLTLFRPTPPNWRLHWLSHCRRTRKGSRYVLSSLSPVEARVSTKQTKLLLVVPEHAEVEYEVSHILGAYHKAKSENRLLRVCIALCWNISSLPFLALSFVNKIRYVSLHEYLLLLRFITGQLSAFGPNAVIFSAAAVSDFYIPTEEMVNLQVLAGMWALRLILLVLRQNIKYSHQQIHLA